MRRVSGPLLDRLDLRIEMPRSRRRSSSHGIAGRRSAVVARESLRRAAGTGAQPRTGRMPTSSPARRARQSPALRIARKRLLEDLAQRIAMSARGVHRLLRVARTIADLAAARRSTRGSILAAAGCAIPAPGSARRMAADIGLDRSIDERARLDRACSRGWRRRRALRSPGRRIRRRRRPSLEAARAVGWTRCVAGERRRPRAACSRQRATVQRIRAAAAIRPDRASPARAGVWTLTPLDDGYPARLRELDRHRPYCSVRVTRTRSRGRSVARRWHAPADARWPRSRRARRRAPRGMRRDRGLRPGDRHRRRGPRGHARGRGHGRWRSSAAGMPIPGRAPIAPWSRRDPGDAAAP